MHYTWLALCTVLALAMTAAHALSDAQWAGESHEKDALNVARQMDLLFGEDAEREFDLLVTDEARWDWLDRKVEAAGRLYERAKVKGRAVVRDAKRTVTEVATNVREGVSQVAEHVRREYYEPVAGHVRRLGEYIGQHVGPALKRLLSSIMVKAGELISKTRNISARVLQTLSGIVKRITGLVDRLPQAARTFIGAMHCMLNIVGLKMGSTSNALDHISDIQIDNLAPSLAEPAYLHRAFAAGFPVLASKVGDAGRNGLFSEIDSATEQSLKTSASVSGLIISMENDPVVGGLGSFVYGGKRDMEWDIFLPNNAGAFLDNKEALLDKVLVAHGNVFMWIKENLLGASSYDEIRKSGGLTLREWIGKFQRTFTTVPFTTMEEFSETFNNKYGAPFRVVLDVKSASSTSAEIETLVTVLRSVGIQVSGVGSFKLDQIPRGPPEDPIKPFLFIHDIFDAPSDVQGLQDVTIMTNGGFFVKFDKDDDEWDMSLNFNHVARERVNAIKAVPGVTGFGIYVQEAYINHSAMQVLADLLSSTEGKQLFNAGFAFGGPESKWFKDEYFPTNVCNLLAPTGAGTSTFVTGYVNRPARGAAVLLSSHGEWNAA